MKDQTMPIDYHIDTNKGYTIAVWHGHVDAVEYGNHINQLLADANWPPRKLIHLSDLRRAKLDASIDDDVILMAAKKYGEKLGKDQHVKLAIIAGASYDKALVFEKAFMKYQSSSIVFYDLHSACIWLGLDQDEVEKAIQKILT
jgi:hypothetical protein